MESTLETLVREIVRNELLSNWEFWLIQAFVVFLVLTATNFVGGYFKKRGEDYATSQALERITRTIEEIKSELQARHTLRFAALDKRLQTHQEAFGLCAKLHHVIHKRADLQQHLEEFHKLFFASGLYLEPVARAAFWSAYGAALEYSVAYEERPRDMTVLKHHWNEIRSAADAISQAVGLPPLRIDEILPANIPPILDAHEETSFKRRP